MFFTNKRHSNLIHLILAAMLVVSLTGCGSGGGSAKTLGEFEVNQNSSSSRDNKKNVLSPAAPGAKKDGCDVFMLDYSNTSEGYIVARYTGNSPKVKFQLTGNDQTTYTYNLPTNVDTVVPLSAGNGSYTVAVFESIGGDQYATAFSTSINVNMQNEFGPFLYPNQYVNFTANSAAINQAEKLASGATSDLEVIAKIYAYVSENVVYDKEEAENVQSGYLPDVDEVLSTKKGICFDYAALMASMLRSQNIPTRLEIGYAKDAYHAWISVYTKDTGWIDKLIEFNGTEWSLMDPTLAANSADIKKMKDFIGDGTSYVTKYKY